MAKHTLDVAEKEAIRGRLASRRLHLFGHMLGTGSPSNGPYSPIEPADPKAMLARLTPEELIRYNYLLEKSGKGKKK